MFASWSLRSQLVPRLRKFNKDLNILNTVLTDLIARAKSSENKADLEDLQARNYDKVKGGGFRRKGRLISTTFVAQESLCGLGLVCGGAYRSPLVCCGFRINVCGFVEGRVGATSFCDPFTAVRPLEHA